MSYIDKIDEFCAERRMSQSRFEREAGIAKGLISKWKKKGIVPRFSTLRKIADYMRISVEDLTSEDPADFGQGYSIPDNWSHGPDIVRDATVRYIPIYRYECIDSGQPDPDDIISHLAVLPETLEHSGDCFGMKISDSSMAPDFEPGDTLIVRSDPEPVTGDIVIAVIPGEQTVCRRLIRSGDNLILQPFNRHFDPLVYRIEELDFLPVFFKGKVIAAVRQVNSSSYSLPEE